MRKEGLRGCIRGRRRNTTRRDKRTLPAEDLVRRNFAVAAPNRLWTADITYVDTEEGFLYMAFVLDAYFQEARRMGDGEPPEDGAGG
jgi:putative transposase